MTAPILVLPQGPRVWASSRMRGYWLQDAAPDLFEVMADGKDPDFKAREIVVFQKRHSVEDIALAHQLKGRGVSVVYDLTDPLWWFQPDEVNTMLGLADVVTVSSPGMLNVVKQIEIVKKYKLIPDRMLPDFHPTVKEHGEVNPVTLVWFGISWNRVSLAGVFPVLNFLHKTGHAFRLRIIDEAVSIPLGDTRYGNVNPVYPVEHVPWTLETFHAQLATCDVALLPPFPGPWGQLKGNNKHVTAWWAGLPVTDGFDPGELRALIVDPQERARQGKANREQAVAEYDIAASIDDWRLILEEVERDRAVSEPVLDSRIPALPE